MYKLILNKTFKYNLMIKGYTKTNSLSFRTTDYISIIAEWKTLRFFNAIIKTPLTLNILVSKLMIKPSATINFIKVPIVALSRIRSKINISLNITMPIKALSKLMSKAYIIISLPIALSWNLIIGRFFPLYEHDVQTLGFLDSKTLGELNYIEIS